jgi:hypothetical protein
MSVRRAFPFAEFNPNTLGLQKMKETEWIIPNRLGGYSSSTVTGLNTSRFHGLLVSGCGDLRRMLYLQKLGEDVIFPNSTVSLKLSHSILPSREQECRRRKAAGATFPQLPGSMGPPIGRRRRLFPEDIL